MLLAALSCLSLAGCAGVLFTDTVGWGNATFVNEKRQIYRDIEGMTLVLSPDGTGEATGIPRGHQKWAKNICIEVTSEDRYTGDVTWRTVDDFHFEISFPGSKYTITSGPGKFVANWTEIRIYTCNWGGEYWSLKGGQ